MKHSADETTVAPDAAGAEGQGESMFLLLEAARRVQERLEGELEAIGLSMAKYAALVALVAAREPLTLSELAGRLRCVRSNITQLVDRLEADGLVQRVSDPADRRAIRAVVTELGAARRAAGAETMNRLQAELAERVDPAVRQPLHRALSALC